MAKRKLRKGGAELYLMPRPTIKRAEIAEMVRLRGVIRRDRQRLIEMGLSIMARMQKGIELELCSTPVEVQEYSWGASRGSRLLVDGRPVDDFSTLQGGPL